MTRPAIAMPRFATGGAAVVTEPNAGKKDTGHVANEVADHAEKNWLQKSTYEWLKFLDDDVGTAVYGDGSDGDVVISTNTTLARDMYYDNLTVDSGAFLSTAGFRVFVRNTLTLNDGAIDANGSLGAGGGAAGTGAASAFLAGGTDGGAGATSGSGGNATGQSNSVGGDGGDGGDGSSGTGGSGGTTGVPVAANGGYRHLRALTSGQNDNGTALQAGAGGGGGCGDGTNSGGGGGGGGGILIVLARLIVVTGTSFLVANGGSGGSALAGNAGGGGGGGGGAVFLVTRSSGLTLTVAATGGSGGLASGTGANGADGSDGTVIAVQH